MSVIISVGCNGSVLLTFGRCPAPCGGVRGTLVIGTLL